MDSLRARGYGDRKEGADAGYRIGIGAPHPLGGAVAALCPYRATKTTAPAQATAPKLVLSYIREWKARA